MKKTKEIILLCLVGVQMLYIKYLRTEVEIARFDCMMKMMKEHQNYRMG